MTTNPPSRGVPMQKAGLITLLEDMLERIKSDDSYEGSIEYLLPLDEDDVDHVDFRVMAAYRISNTGGSQGGMRLINEPRPT